MIGERLASARAATSDVAIGKLAARRRIALALLSVAAWSSLLLYCLIVWFDWMPWLRGWNEYPTGWSSHTFPYPSFFLILPVIAFIVALWTTVRLTELSQESARVSDAIKRFATPAFLTLLVLLGFGLQIALLGVKSENALGLLVHRVTDRVSTSYYTMALARPNIDAYFANYPAIYTTKLCPHCHDHPPGPALFYWASLRAASGLPLEWQAGLAGEARELMGNGQMATGLKARYTDAELLGATLGGGLVLLLSCMVVVPLFGLAKLLGPPGFQYRLAALGLALPGLMLMAPLFDQMYALMAGSALYFGLRGLLAQSVRSTWLWATLAGISVAIGLFFSWAFGVVVALLAALWLICVVGSRRLLFSHPLGKLRLSHKQAWVWLAGWALAIVIPLLLVVFATGLDLVYVFNYNLANTARAEAQRPYLVWLFYGPVEFLQFMGLPLALVTAFAVVIRPFASAANSWFNRLNPYAMLFFLIVIGLDIAGKSKAEQGRLFIFLMPLALTGVYLWVGRNQPGWRFVTRLFFAQMLVCLILGARWFV